MCMNNHPFYFNRLTSNFVITNFHICQVCKVNSAKYFLHKRTSISLSITSASLMNYLLQVKFFITLLSADACYTVVNYYKTHYKARLK